MQRPADHSSRGLSREEDLISHERGNGISTKSEGEMEYFDGGSRPEGVCRVSREKKVLTSEKEGSSLRGIEVIVYIWILDTWDFCSERLQGQS
jgi:hypothetical protein